MSTEQDIFKKIDCFMLQDHHPAFPRSYSNLEDTRKRASVPTSLADEVSSPDLGVDVSSDAFSSLERPPGEIRLGEMTVLTTFL